MNIFGFALVVASLLLMVVLALDALKTSSRQRIEEVLERYCCECIEKTPAAVESSIPYIDGHHLIGLSYIPEER